VCQVPSQEISDSKKYIDGVQCSGASRYFKSKTERGHHTPKMRKTFLAAATEA
jgi:hypothetical protein